MKRSVILAILCVLSLFLGGCEQKEPVIYENTPMVEKVLPDFWCEYFYMIDMDSGRVLIDQKSDEMMFPASMTKVMTSIIALEKIEDPEHVIIPFTEEMMKGLVEASANRAGFVVGDEPTALDHIYGDLLPSGADCSRALAFYISGSEEAFVELMNTKAKELGMYHTHFVNTSGLHDDDHYTTCQDMMKLYLYCLKNPTFVEMIQTQSHRSIPVAHFEDGLGMANFVLIYINQENPQYGYNYDVPGFIGGKSGYTIEGRYTLVCHANINGMNLALVNGFGYNEPHYPCSIEDAANVFNYYREHYELRTVVEPDQYFGDIRVRNTAGENLEVFAERAYTGIVPNDGNLHVVVDLPEVIDGPIKAGDAVGTVKIYDYTELVDEINLVVHEGKVVNRLGIMQTRLYDALNGQIWILSVGLLVLVLGLVLLLVINRNQKS